MNAILLQDEIGQQLFDSLAMRLYLLLEQYSQYQQYMRLIDLQPLTSENLESEKSSRYMYVSYVPIVL